MALTHAMTNQFKLDCLSIVNGKTYKMALYTDTASLDQNTAAYTTTGEVVGTGYTAGGKALTINVSPTIGSDKAYMSFDNPEWPGSTFTARGALIYLDDTGFPTVAVIHFGENKTVSGGTFRVDMPPATPQTAIIRLS